MRIAVTADVHLTPKEEHPERYNALQNILDQSLAEGIEHLLIAGDLFEKDYRSYVGFEQLCRKYPAVQIHIIPGNHDPALSTAKIVGANIQVYTTPTPIEIDSRTFLLVPYVENATMSEKLADSVDALSGRQWILVGHGDYYGGTRQLNPLEPGTYMPLSRNNVDQFGPRAVFLGHIHKPTTIDNVHYMGSPCGLDISETGRRRFLVFDTADGSSEARVIATDVLYYDESFVIVPHDNEVPELRHEAERRIASWEINESERNRVRLRVSARGFATDRSAILKALKDSFDGFRFYKDDEPLIDELSSSSDHQLSAIAERVSQLVAECSWDSVGDEPTREDVIVQALSVIYSD
ncbi:exonuclease SbcCD subunit D [Chloroflexota bacterium]